MKAIRIIAKILSFLFLGIIVSLAVLLGGVRLVGLSPYTVLSGSMEPTYPVGSVIYVASVDTSELKVDDPIIYTIPGGTVVTHRIKEVINPNSPELAFRTKGDANAIADGAPIPARDVIGKPLFAIPYIGYVSKAIQEPVGLVSVIAVCAAVFILSFVADSLATKAETAKKSEAEE